MRPICWLHISDFHITEDNSWSQDVVLSAMCNKIEQQHSQGVKTDFILATGDLAYSGKAEQYTLVASFFDQLSQSSGVAKERIFCVPGNHDINRNRQYFCFLGARSYLVDQSRVDVLLTPQEDLKNLLLRQEAYRKFQLNYFDQQDRQTSPDGLGYVVHLTISGVRLAIVGLDSAWLAAGGSEDHSRLLVGERQALTLFQQVQTVNNSPHIIVTMAHHPCHVLAEFDRLVVQNLIEDESRFFHYGHLHRPEVRVVRQGANDCLTLGAGASFETRLTENSYTMVTLDLLQGVRTVETFRYSPALHAFSSANLQHYAMEMEPTRECNVEQLAQAITQADPSLTAMAYYLAALLLGHKTEFPILGPNGYVFGPLDLLRDEPDGDLKAKTIAFMVFRNVLGVLYTSNNLSEILNNHGSMVVTYGSALVALCAQDSNLKNEIDRRNSELRRRGHPAFFKPMLHTSALLDELSNAQDWAMLRKEAQRHENSPDPNLSLLARRMMARGLASSGEADYKDDAMARYRILDKEDALEALDLAIFVVLLWQTGNIPEAKDKLIAGIEKFPKQALIFNEIAQKIIGAEGDKVFRQLVQSAMAKEYNLDHR